MNKLKFEQLRLVQAKPRISGIRVGKIVAVNAANAPIVDYAGNPLAPQVARATAGMTDERIVGAQALGTPVLLLFEEEDPARPILIDALADLPNNRAAQAHVVAPSPAAAKSGPVQSHDRPLAAAAKLATIAVLQQEAVLIRFAEDGETLRARSAVVLRNLRDPVVVLMLADAEPIVVGQVYPHVPIDPEGAEDAEVVLKGTRVRIEADVELVLKSGACTLQLDARGKAVTTANQIVSRARDTNKVQGGSVQLN